MEKKAEYYNSTSYGQTYEDVSDKTLSIQNMLRSITSEKDEMKNKEEAENGMSDNSSTTSDVSELSRDNSNQSKAQFVDVDVGDTPMETVPVEDTSKSTKPKETPKVVKKKLILNSDLKAAHKILMQIMSDRANYAFMDEIDVVALNLWDYHDRIKEPMWLTKIEEKFETNEYSTITEVIRDLRLMLENCYRYNGLNHYVSKQGMKLEQALETKLSLLPRILQVQTTLYVTSNGKFGEPPVTSSTSLTGRRRTSGRFNADGASTPLSNCIQDEFLNAKLDEKKRQQQERHEELLRYRKEVDEWERDLLKEPNQQQLNAMWEIPAIGQFLLLFQETLALNESSYYELERCFLIPRESKLLAQIFTCLLSSPTQRKREISKNMGMAMPYNVWHRKLKEKVQKWYQVVDNWQDTQWAASDLGIDVHFFEVMGDTFPLDDYQYHELSYYQRVILMKAVCDHCLEMQPTLRQSLDAQLSNQDQRAIVLGEDSSGNTYVHFPQFCGYDLRVYKQAPFPEPELRYIEVDEPDEPEKMDVENKESTINNECEDEANKIASPEQRKRPSNLRQRLTPVIKDFSQRKRSKNNKSSKEKNVVNIKDPVTDSTSKNQEEEKTEDKKISKEDNDKKENDLLSVRVCSPELTNDKVASKLDVKKEESNHNNSNSALVLNSDDHLYNDKPKVSTFTSNFQKVNGQIKTQCKDDESDTKESKVSEASSICEVQLKKDIKNSDDSTVIEKEHVENLPFDKDVEDSERVVKEGEKSFTNVETTDLVKEEETKQEKDIVELMEPQVAEPSVKSNLDTDQEKLGIICNNDPTNETDKNLSSSDNDRSEMMDTNVLKKQEPLKQRLELPKIEPDRDVFELVCDSVESLKSLVEEFAEKEPVEVTKGRKKKIIKPPPRTQSEVELHERLARLLVELSPHESKLCNSVGRVKERLRKEVDNFQDSQEESDSWESESSSGSSSSDSDSSDSDEDEEENGEDKKAKEEQEQLKQSIEEEVMETDEPFLGISTRAQKISKKKELIKARKRAKLCGNKEETKAKKPCVKNSNSTTPTPDSICVTKSVPISINIGNIYQTLQNQVAAACAKTAEKHSSVSSTNIPVKSQSKIFFSNPKLSTAPAKKIIVDESTWKEIQNDPTRQKEIVLKYLIQQKQKLSGQSKQIISQNRSTQELHYAANKSINGPVPTSSLLSNLSQTYQLAPVTKQHTHGESPASSAVGSRDKQIQYLQSMLKEPQRKVESNQKEIFLEKLSTSSIPSNDLSGEMHSSTSDQQKMAEVQRQLLQAKKQKENMLAQQWLQQLLSLQQTTSVKPVSQVSTLPNIRLPTTSRPETNIQTLPNSQTANAVRAIPNVLATSIPSAGTKVLTDGSVVKIQANAASTSDNKTSTTKGKQEMVVSLDCLQKILNTSQNTTATTTITSHSINNNAVRVTTSQLSNPTITKLPPTVQTFQAASQPTNQGQICIVKMADGTLRTLKFVNQKIPVNKKVLTSSLLSNQGSTVFLNSPVSQNISKPQCSNNVSNVQSTVTIQNSPIVANQSPSVKPSPSVLTPPSISASTTKTTIAGTPKQIVPIKITLTAEEFKIYKSSRVLPSRYNSVITVPQSHKEAEKSGENGSLQLKCQDMNSSNTDINSSNKIVQ
ncbi:uncharacterized protein [Antedon mediterranea]|uniref:uncharacterized protein n=1 Tax=Antedon mediterranea TaxID=105859 RepID=UPI003AF6D0B4